MPATLAQRFQAEVRRSPKKAAVLALLVGVALWYWAPLFTKWTSGKPGNKKQPPGAELMAAVAAPATQPGPAISPAPAVGAAGAATPAVNWQSLLEQIESDARMRSAVALAVARDPFRPMAATTAAPAEAQAGMPADAAQEHPEEDPAPALEQRPVMLPLTAIIFSRVRRAALIGGRTYQQGDVCPAHGMEFRIVSIDRDHIVLERLADGYRFEQPLPRHDHSPHLEIRRGQ